MKKGYIYKITSPSGKSYIGQTYDIKMRTNFYRTLNCKNQVKLYNSLKKYGWDKHRFEILEEIEYDKIRLDYLEKYYIFYFGDLNLTDGGEGGIPSEETRRKKSKSMIGNTNGKGNKGNKHTEESKKKMSDSAKKRGSNRKGIKFTEEQKKRLSESHMGQVPWNKGLKGVMPAPWNKGLKYKIK